MMSLTEYSDSVKEEVATVLHSLGVPTIGTQKVDQQKTGKQVRLACWSRVMNNECPNGRDCRFLHDKAYLQANAREIAKQISKSPHFSGLVDLLGLDDDTLRCGLLVSPEGDQLWDPGGLKGPSEGSLDHKA